MSSGFLGLNQSGWNSDFLVNLLNNARDVQGGAQNSAGSIQQFLQPFLAQMATNGGNQLFGTDGSGGQMGDLLQRIKDSTNSLKGDFSGGDLSKIPGLDQSIGNQQNLQNLGWQSLDPLMSLINNNGSTAGGNQSIQSLLGLANGGQQGYGQMNALGQTLLGNSGKTDKTENMQGLGSNIFNQGGFNQQLNGIFDQGTGIVGNSMTPAMQQMLGGLDLKGALGVGGLTQTGASAEQVGLNQLQNQGANPYSNAASQTGLGITQSNPLLSMNDAVSMARNQAGTQAANAAETAHREALARGGGAGATVANGLQNQALADFQDKALQNESSAVEQARLGQQGLQLQHWGQGADLLNQQQALANQRENIAGNLIGNVENAATQRYGTVLGAANGLFNTENARLNTGIGAEQGASSLAAGRENNGTNLLNSSQQGQNQNIQSGSSLLNSMFGNQLAAYQGANQIQGTQNQAGANASQNYNQLLQGMYGNANNIGNQQNAGAQTSLGFTNSQYNQLNNLLGQNLGTANLANTSMSQSSQQLSSQQAQYLQLIAQALGSQTGLTNGFTKASTPLDTILGGIAGIVGAIPK